MQKQTKRKDQILAITLDKGSISVVELSQMLRVSTQTIRRDLDDLCSGNLLQRRHGVVESTMDTKELINAPYNQRVATNPDYKASIARQVAQEIEDGSTIFISIGTTPTMVADALKYKKNLTVMTNNLNAAMLLSEELSNRIIIPGGELRLPDRDLLGDDVVSFFDSHRADYGIFGVAGVTAEGTLLDFNASEVRIREKITTNSQTSILVVDSTKFGRVAPAAGGVISAMDRIYMDRHLTKGFESLFESLGDRLILVGDGNR